MNDDKVSKRIEPLLPFVQTVPNPNSFHEFMVKWVDFVTKEPTPADNGFEDATLVEAKKQLDEVAKQAWKDFSGEVSLSVEELKDRVEAAVRGMTVPPTVRIENVVAEGGMVTLDIVTNDRHLARSFQMSQDAEYKELVARIRKHCGTDEDAVYHCTVEESAIITRYMDKPISLTAEVKKSDLPLITEPVTFDYVLYKKALSGG